MLNWASEGSGTCLVLGGKYKLDDDTSCKVSINIFCYLWNVMALSSSLENWNGKPVDFVAHTGYKRALFCTFFQLK